MAKKKVVKKSKAKKSAPMSYHTVAERMEILQNTPEVNNCVKLLYSAFRDCGLMSHIRYGFLIEGDHFELTFQKTNTLRAE